MRKGWRNILAGLCWLLFGGLVPAAPADPVPGRSEGHVRLTVEIAWSTPSAAVSGVGVIGGNDVELEVSEGRVIEAVASPADSALPLKPGPERMEGGGWRLGSERVGRVRARVEAPVGASLLIRAGGQALRFPLSYILDGPQKTRPQATVEVRVERVAWDVVAVDLGDGQGLGRSDGVLAAGARAPVSVAFHVLTPEPTEVAVRCSLELRPVRGGEPVWRGEVRETVPTNAPVPPSFVIPLVAPDVEGTYVLEFRASWEPAPAHDGGKFLNRLIRRGKRGLFGPATASRRVTLAVLGSAEGKSKPKPGAAATTPASGATAARVEHDQDVDAIDLSRLRAHQRPSASGRSPLTAAGRAAWPVPEEALAASTPRDRLRGLIARAGPEVAQLGPADGGGLAWSAVGLKVTHPGRPHRLSLTVVGGHPAALGVALAAGATAPGARPRTWLDTCASGPPILPDGPPVTFSWLTWPDAGDPVLVLVNRAAGAPVQVGSVRLTELAELPPGPVVEAPAGAPARGLGLYLGGRDVLGRFGAGTDCGTADPLAASRNLAAYLAYCGASAAVLPEGLADRVRRRALDGTAAEDATGPDRLDLAVRVLGRRKLTAWLELSFAGTLPGLPAAGSPEALARGLVRVDRQGRADGPAYHPLSAEVGEAMRRRVSEAVAAHKGPGNLAGVLVRLGPGPTVLGSPDTGYDDATFARFVREAFDPEAARIVPGVGGDDPARFVARSRFLAGPGRTPWLTWRSRRIASLYAAMAVAARQASPTATLAVTTPGSNDGPAGTEARRADLAGLAPSLAWRAVGLDLDAWPTDEAAPIVLRGVSLGPDDLARDLATSPELDAKVAARPARGLLLDDEDGAASLSTPTTTASGLDLTSTALDGGPDGDEPFGHALAALDARWVWLAASAVAGSEERLRRFARVFRAAPATPPLERQALAFGVSVRTHPAGVETYLVMANDSPYPVLLDAVLGGPAEAPVYDFARGTPLQPRADAAGRHLVLDLPPFGVSAVRVGAPGVTLASVTPYPSEAVLTGIRARHDALSAQLSRLTQGGDKDRGRGGPPNPGFEPEAAVAVPSRGWQVVGAKGGAVVIDPAGPHSGRAALRLDAPATPASALCDDFVPAVHSVLLVRAWLRADRPDAKVRVWIEGEAAGKPYRRVSSLTVQPAWAERAVRASDVPPGGLDAARLRFEMLTAGSLWVDDLAVTGETLSEPERRNARNALLAALQAFQEKRYADFARLAGSHWARHPGAAVAEPSPERVAADRAGLIRKGDSSALPQGRRLR